MRESKLPRFLSVILTLACLLGLLAIPAQAVGSEAPAWAAEAYEILADHGISTRTDSTPIDRSGFVTLLVMVLWQTVPQEELDAYPAAADNYFADAASGVAREAVGYGILEGSLGSDGRIYFNGKDHLTREQAAKMLVSLLDFFSQKLGHTVEPSDSPAVYRDADSISDWALPYTQTVATYGLMIGDELGNFNPRGELNYPAAVVMLSRTVALMDEALGIGQDPSISEQDPSGSGQDAVSNPLGLLRIQSQANLLGVSTFGAMDTSTAKPLTGWARGYHVIDNGDGTISFLVVTDPNSQTFTTYDKDGTPTVSSPQGITVETFAADGSLISTKFLELELPMFGTFFDSGEHFYIAFWQLNQDKDDSREVIRVVQYDRNWNRLGSVSVYGGESYTTHPFRSTVSRMAVSGDGKTVTLYTARNRYDTHQSNLTIIMDTKPFRIQTLMGEEFPSNHVSHSFGQFVRYDGNTMVTVDHGDAYPRSFYLQKGTQGRNGATLLAISGDTGQNVTHAIGSGFEVSDSGYLFLGCSAPQKDFWTETNTPWNVFLTYTDKNLNETTLTWLTDSDTTINTARLVKLDGNTFVAMWAEEDGVHWQKLDGKGNKVGEEQLMSGAIMPPTDPVVIDGDICWIQNQSKDFSDRNNVFLYRLEVE